MARKLVIAVSNLKGGVGKSTTSIYLAGAAVRSGRSPVTLVDADPQASSAEWLEAAPLDGVELVEAPTARLVTRALEQAGRHLVVVDTPPGAGDEKIVRAVLEAADVVIVPTRAGGTEASRVVTTLSLIPASIPRGIVVCAARTATRDLDETVASWKESGEQIWGVIPERVSIAGGPAADLSPVGLAYYENVLLSAIAAT
ncbi:MAG TPA: ParA family protein [Acidimicrobiales bacterium]|nr:ParA family protein [Acidimicrobiales bacterium]